MKYFLNNFTSILCCVVLFFGVIVNIYTMIKTRDVGAAILYGLHSAQIGAILSTFLYILLTTISLILV